MDLHLQQLEQISIYIPREVKAKFKNPAVMDHRIYGAACYEKILISADLLKIIKL